MKEIFDEEVKRMGLEIDIRKIEDVSKLKFLKKAILKDKDLEEFKKALERVNNKK